MSDNPNTNEIQRQIEEEERRKAQEQLDMQRREADAKNNAAKMHDNNFNFNLHSNEEYDRYAKLDSFAGEKGADITKEGVSGVATNKVVNSAENTVAEDEAYGSLKEQIDKSKAAMNLIVGNTKEAATVYEYNKLMRDVEASDKFLNELGMGDSAAKKQAEFENFIHYKPDTAFDANGDSNKAGRFVTTAHIEKDGNGNDIFKIKDVSYDDYLKNKGGYSGYTVVKEAHGTALGVTDGKASDLSKHYVSSSLSVSQMFSAQESKLSQASIDESLASRSWNKNVTSSKDAVKSLTDIGSRGAKYLREHGDENYAKIVTSNNPAKREAELGKYIKELEKNPGVNKDLISAAKMEQAGLKASRANIAGGSGMSAMSKGVTALSLAGGGTDSSVSGIKFAHSNVAAAKKVVATAKSLKRNNMRNGGKFRSKTIEKTRNIVKKTPVLKNTGAERGLSKLADYHTRRMEKFKDRANYLDKLDRLKKDKHKIDGRLNLNNFKKETKLSKASNAATKNQKRLDKLAKRQNSKIAIVRGSSKLESWGRGKIKTHLDGKQEKLARKIARNKKKLNARQARRQWLKNTKLGKIGTSFMKVVKAPGFIFGFFANAIEAIKRKIKLICVLIPVAAAAGTMAACYMLILFLQLIGNFIADVPDSVFGTQDINYNQYIVDKTTWMLGNGYTKVAARDAYWHYVFHSSYKNYSIDNREGFRAKGRFQYYWFNQLDLADDHNETPFEHIYVREEVDNTTQGGCFKGDYSVDTEGDGESFEYEANGQYMYLDTYVQKDDYGNNVTITLPDNDEQTKLQVKHGGERQELKSININIVPILSMAHYRFSGEINYDNYLTVLGYSYTMWVRSHEINKFDSNDTSYDGGHTGYHLKIIDPHKNNDLYKAEYGNGAIKWNKSKTYDQCTRGKGNCSNIYVHGYNAAMGNTMGSIKAFVDEFCEDVAGVCKEFWGWVTKKTPSSTLPMGCELYIDGYFSGVTDGYADGVRDFDNLGDDYRMSDDDYKEKYENVDDLSQETKATLYDGAGEDNSKWDEIKKYFKLKTSPLHVYGSVGSDRKDVTIYNSGSAFLVRYDNSVPAEYHKGFEVKNTDNTGQNLTLERGCDNIAYMQFSDKEDTVVKKQHFPWPLSDDNKIEGKGDAGTWCATTCGKRQHKHGPNCCCKDTMQAIRDPYSGHVSTVPTGHRHDDGTCDYSQCEKEEHEHSPWKSKDDPGCWTTVAICLGHCGGHAIGKMDIAIMSSWQGLMSLDDLKVPQMMITSDFSGALNFSEMAWTLKSWKSYWINKTNSWYSKSRNFNPARVLAWGVERVPGWIDKAVEGLKKLAVSILTGDFLEQVKDWLNPGKAMARMIGNAQEPRDELEDSEEDDDLFEFSSWYDDSGTYIRPELAEGIITNYGNDWCGSLTDDLQQARGYENYEPEEPDQSANWEDAIDEWSGSILWQVYFPFETDYPYPEGDHSVFYYQTDDGEIKYKADTNKATLSDPVEDTPPDGITREESGSTRDWDYEAGSGPDPNKPYTYGDTGNIDDYSFE